jgi:phosphoglycerate dehydrogenase-like enzyme
MHHLSCVMRPMAAALGALLLFCMHSSHAAEDSDNVPNILQELGIREDSTPVRERKNWRAPKKIVVVGGAPGFPDRVRGAEIIRVQDVPAAAKAAQDADIVVGMMRDGTCDSSIIENARQLRWILSLSAGVEECLANPSVRSRNVLVTNMRALGSAPIAEHAIALALALARNFDTFIDNQSQGKWGQVDPVTTRLQVLDGKTLLVVGLGGIGTEVAKRAHGIGMKVIATRASGRTGPDYVSYVGLADELPALAKTADVIVNAAPLTVETTGIFNAKFFATLKPNVLFINIARGGAVVTDDLVAALKEGRIAGAGLDVTDPEPLPPDHPLWHAPNVIITPHISASTDVSTPARQLLVRENLRRYIAGEKMLSVVDLQRGY